MLDEIDYAQRWAKSVLRFSGSFDRIQVIDGGSKDGTLEKLRELGIEVVSHSFENHFADQRNFGCEQIGTDWILELDADEIASSPLLGGLRAIVADTERAGMDCVGIPRLNLIDDKLTEGPGHKRLDYQYRLHHRSCHWRGAVHEEIADYRARRELHIVEGQYLIHDKSSARHAARNQYYQTIRP